MHVSQLSEWRRATSNLSISARKPSALAQRSPLVANLTDRDTHRQECLDRFHLSLEGLKKRSLLLLYERTGDVNARMSANSHPAVLLLLGSRLPRPVQWIGSAGDRARGAIGDPSSITPHMQPASHACASIQHLCLGDSAR